MSEFNDVFVQYWNAELERRDEWNHPSDRLCKKLLATNGRTLRATTTNVFGMGEEW